MNFTFSMNTGTASTTTAVDLGSASIRYVSARQPWFICEPKFGFRKYYCKLQIHSQSRPKW